MLFPLIGSGLQLSAPSPLTKNREQYAFMRGPAAAPTVRVGTIDAYRLGQQHLGYMPALPSPKDAVVGSFGIQEAGNVSVQLAAPSSSEPYVDVPDNRALLTDGVDDYLFTPSTAKLNFGTGSFSVVMRVRFDDFTFPRTFAPVNKQGTAWNTIAVAGRGWGVGQTYSATTINVWVNDGATLVNGGIVCDNGFQPGQLMGQWADVAIIFDRDGAAKTVRLVINGVLQTNTLDISAAAGTLDNANDLNWGITVGWMQCGAADELQVWNRALHFAEVQAMRRKRLIGSERGLALLWRCDEGLGVSVADATGNGHTAIFASAPAWTAGAPLDAVDQFFRVPTLLRNQLVDVDLVTRTQHEDGTWAEMVNERRGVAKTITRRGNVLTIDVIDVDIDAANVLIPAKTYTTADWPEIFVDHVNRPVPQGVGTIVKVPLTYLVKNAGVGPWKYGAGEVLGGINPTVLAVYRDQRLVSPVEYGNATQVVAGTTHFLVTFAKEQLDNQGRLFTLEADILFAGSRVASDELQRILQLLGATTDPGSFAYAASVCTLIGLYVDAGYAIQKTGVQIIQALLFICRAQLYRTASGAFGIWIDAPRDLALAVADNTDQCKVDSFTYPEIPRSVRLKYRPSSCQKSEFTGDLSRPTSGSGKEEVWGSEYLRDHVVADKVLSYLTKRQQNLAAAAATIHGVQLAVGKVIAIDAPSHWAGVKVWAAPGVQRPADRNELTLTEYVPDTFVYTPGNLPADATNGYQPDYSQTLPLMPTGLVVVSQGTLVDSDGKVTAYALVRATPPAVNWARVMVMAVDDATSEYYQAQLLFNVGTGFYEATISGMRPGRPSHLEAWAVNSTNVDGFHTNPTVAFTTATNSNVPSAPSAVGIQQMLSFQLDYTWTRVVPAAGNAPIDYYVLEEHTGAGAYVEVWRGDALGYTRPGVGNGLAYQGRVKAVDKNKNESTYTTSSALTTAPVITDSHIPTAGINGGTIGNGSINQGRTSTSTGGGSGTIGAGAVVDFTFGTDFAFDVELKCTNVFNYLTVKSSNNTHGVAFANDVSGFALNYVVAYRQVAP